MYNLNRLGYEVEMKKQMEKELLAEYYLEYNDLKTQYSISLKILKKIKEKEED